jgi:hypothetical protein
VRFDESFQFVDSGPLVGGGATTDGTHILTMPYDDSFPGQNWIVTLDGDLNELGRVSVASDGPDDYYTDIAYDGTGNVWAVRPQSTNGPARMVKWRISDGAKLLEITPPDQDIAGVELADGILWAVSTTTAYEMEP